MLRHRGRRRDGPRPGALRALHEPAHVEGQQRHDGPYLQERHREGAQGRVPGQDRAGHSPHHRRDQTPHSAAGADQEIRRDHHRDRRHGGRHRVAAVHRVGAPAPLFAGLPEYGAGSPDADPLHGRFGRVEDQTHAALGEGPAGERSPARHPRAARRTSAVDGAQAQGGAVLQRRRQRRDGVDRRADDLRSAAENARTASGRGRAGQTEPDGRQRAGHGRVERIRREGETPLEEDRDRAGRQVHRTARRLQIDLRIVHPRRGGQRLQGQAALCQFGEDHPRERRRAAGQDVRHSGGSGLRQPRHRGEDRGRALRPREQHPVPGHLPGHAVRRDRVRAPRAESRRCQFERDGADAASGDRPDGGAEGRYGQRRHDASGRLSLCAEERLESRCRLRQTQHFGASPPPLRVQQRLSGAVRGGRHEGRGRESRHESGGGRRDREPSLVRRYAVPSRIQEHRIEPLAAVRGLCEGRAGVCGEEVITS